MKGLLTARFKVKYDFGEMTDSMVIFSRIRTVGGVLCFVGKDELFLHV